VDKAYKLIEVIEKKRKKIIASKLNASAGEIYSPLAHFGTNIAIITSKPAF